MLKYDVTISQDGLLANSMSKLIHLIFILFFYICFLSWWIIKIIKQQYITWEWNCRFCSFPF